MKALVSALLVLAAATTAAAEPTPIAYVDEIVVAGGPDRMHARTFVVMTVRRGGMTPSFAVEDAATCGDDPACLTEKAQLFGAAVALRMTVVEAGDRVVVSMLASDARGAFRREVVPAADLHAGDDRLASVLRELGPAPKKTGPSRFAAWSLTGLSAALAIGGAAALWYAHDLRDEFYAKHVASNGDVFGISPADARAEERRARQWSYIGGFTLGAAAVAGVGASILFVRSPSGEARPAGVTVAWELP